MQALLAWLLFWCQLASAQMGDEPIMCVCGKVFDTQRALNAHQARFCQGAPSNGTAAEGTAAEESDADSEPVMEPDPSDEADASEAEAEHARSLFKVAFKGLTGLRLLYNASNAQVQAVRDFVADLMAPIRSELTRRFSALISADETTPLPDLSVLIGSVTNAFQGLHSSYMEQKARTALLPDLLPVRRVLGTRSEQMELPDKRIIVKQVEDIIYDYDVLKHLNALHEHNAEVCADFLSSTDRWFNQPSNEISDACHGLGLVRHPLLLAAVQSGLFPLLLHYYMDGIGLTSPLGMAASTRKVAVSYVCVLNFSSSHRTSEHCIIPVSVCYEKDWSRYDEVDLVCGSPNEPANGTSLGAQVRRLGDPELRTPIRVPPQFASHPHVETVVQPNGTTFHQVCCCGGVALVSADSPAAGQIFGTKIAFGPNTVSICRLCYCKQVDGDNHHAHCVPNSFLPWTTGSGTEPENGFGLFDGLVCTDESLTVNYDPDRMGAKQVHQLRTVKSTRRTMNIATLLNDGPELDFYLQSIGVRTYSHAFSRTPFPLHVQSVMDLMHIELLELITHHLSKLLWTFHRVLGWLPSVEAFNMCVRSFLHWSRGSRRSAYILSEGALKGDLENCSVGGLWTAHHAMIFMIFSVELLGDFVPADQKDHDVWRCWCLHHTYFMMLLQRSFTLMEIRTLDQTIYTMQTLFLKIYGVGCWLPKFHFAQHFPVRTSMHILAIPSPCPHRRSVKLFLSHRLTS